MSPDFTPISIEQVSLGNAKVSRRRNAFNDKRLSLTYQVYANRLVSSKTDSVRQTSRTDSEVTRFYRFLKNEKVSIPEGIKMSCQLLSSLSLEGRHVLVIGDSSSFTMSPNASELNSALKASSNLFKTDVTTWAKYRQLFGSEVDNIVRGDIDGLVDIITNSHFSKIVNPL